MKKTLLLNQPVSSVIAGMGHKDTLAIGDCGLPIPAGPERIDLAVEKGVPSFETVLNAVCSELCVEKIVIATEMRDVNPDLYHKMKEQFQQVEIEEVPHDELKKRTAACKAVIRTGECKAYANIILQSGVTF